MTTATLSSSFVQRLIGAAMLDRATYEDVEADSSATPQALAVVILSSMAAAIGARGMSGTSATLAFFAAASVLAMLAWAAWALVVFEIGGRILAAPETRVDPGQLLRTLGFAATPGLLQVFAAMTEVRTPVFAIAVVWALAASVVAVRQALDFTSTARALAVCAVGAILVAAFAVVIGLLFGPALASF